MLKPFNDIPEIIFWALLATIIQLKSIIPHKIRGMRYKILAKPYCCRWTRTHPEKKFWVWSISDFGFIDTEIRNP
jgi:hypothetical protein